ncbi:vWA domain-containing protein [Cystobacter ferrugineus]|uniref:VWA domain-containing protein n=1 Tax=Cystobacter ferrugineus TaxID=83449 RepID=A0A1L9BB23_9BACT|nr:VWA domain-containing protein [Cystobacter ferrugineus]OJH39439.1 VWA domain-containing protein [Cystobacter ferrugineus]
MNKTAVFVSLAGVLALTALVLGLPPSPFSTPPEDSHGASPVRPHGPLNLQPRAEASGALKMTARLSHPYIPPGTSELFATVDITGMEVPGARRMPVNLALVIDRSTSMRGYKLQQAKQAARHLVDLLREDDWLAIVHYGSDVRGLRGLPATPDNRKQMLQYIDGIWDDGGTNISAGLQEGRAQVRASGCTGCVERIILLSDGQPTEGLIEDADLSALVRDIRTGGITVSAIGVGTDFNEDLMQGFAELGSGAYGFLEDAAQLGSLFQKDLRQASTSVARDVALSFTLPQGVRLEEMLGYRFQQEGRRVTVRLPDFSSGQTERVVARLIVEDARVDSPVHVTEVSLSFRPPRDNERQLHVVDLGARVTPRMEEILARRDKEATVYAARALSAKNLTLAAEALREGRKEEAKSYVASNKALFEQAGEVATPSAVAADLAEQQELLRDYEQAEHGAAVDAAVKRSKSKSLKSFGRLGSTY